MSAEEAAHDSHAPTVLVVDDDRALGSGLITALSLDGLDVVHRSSGRAALEYLERSGKADVIVLDVMMPDIDGWDVLRKLRENPVTAAIPVLMLTALGDTDSRVRGLEGGADDYVIKPFSVKELRARVKALLRRGDLSAEVNLSCSLSVLAPNGGRLFVASRDIYYIDGMRNYVYVHGFDSRFLCDLSLGEIERRGLPSLFRLHRSYIANMDHVSWCGWVTRSAFKVRLRDANSTELPVSRSLVMEVQRRLGLR